MRGLSFGGAYPRREICVSKSIGLAVKLEVNLPFLLCFTLHLRAFFQVQASGAYIWRGDLTEGFSRYRIGGLIFGGAYTWRGLFSEFYGLLIAKFLLLNSSDSEQTYNSASLFTDPLFSASEGKLDTRISKN